MIAIKQDKIKKWQSQVPDDKVFLCCDGQVFRSLKNLAAALKEMSGQVYQYHVNGDKNDFSNWVHDVVGDVTLAYQLRKAKSRVTAASCVKDRLEWLQERA
jgi:hypothetical protein